MKRVFLGIVTVLIVAGLAPVSRAFDYEEEAIPVLIDTVRNNCGTLNCGSVAGGGYILYDSTDGHRPHVFRVWTSPNECLRIDIQDVTQGGCSGCANLDAYVNCTGGVTTRVQHATNPVIVFDDGTFPKKGFCTVSVTEIASASPQARAVEVSYGRYTEDNVPNCN